MPTRRQAIIWSNDGLITDRDASLGLNELTTCIVARQTFADTVQQIHNYCRILEDLDFAKDNNIDDGDIKLLYSCLEMSRDSLVVSEDLLPMCLLGRLGQNDNKDHPAIHRLLQQAARPSFDCLYSSQGKYWYKINSLYQHSRFEYCIALNNEMLIVSHPCFRNLFLTYYFFRYMISLRSKHESACSLVLNLPSDL